MIDIHLASCAAEQAAYAAGTHLQASRSRLTEVLVTRRQPQAVVDDIEREALALISEVVRKRFKGCAIDPDDRDDGDAHEVPGDGSPRWLVRPIDGAANYLRGHPQYAVSIALVEAGEARLGVVYDPCRNEFFGAISGRGAVLNGQAIRCAPPRTLPQAHAATVFPTQASLRMPAYIGEFGRVVRSFGGLRRSGSMALEMAYLAAGRIDAYWQHEMRPHDAVAGELLLRESGALVHARDGQPLLRCRSVLACTPTLFEPFLSLLAET